MDRFWSLIEGIVRFFLIKIFRLRLTDAQIAAFMQFVKFGVVGVTNTAVSYFTYLLVYLPLERAGTFSNRTNYLAGTVVGFIVSVAWSFFWNNRLVFKESDTGKRNMWLALFKTYIAYSFTGLIVSPLLLILWVEVIGISATIAPLINSVLLVPINFLINKFWAFRGKKPDGEVTHADDAGALSDGEVTYENDAGADTVGK